MASLFVKRIIPEKSQLLSPVSLQNGTFHTVANSHSTRNQAAIWSILWQQYAAANQRCQAPITTALL
jgi:hypothetical protein